MDISTYDREIERYGGPDGMAVSEGIFQISSDVAISLLSSTKLKAVDKIVMAAYATDLFMSSIGISYKDRLNIYSQSSGKREKRDPAFNRRFKLLCMVLGNRSSLPEEYKTINTLVNNNSEELAALGSSLKKLDDLGKLSNRLIDVYDSLRHMNCNRLLGVNKIDETKVSILLKRALETLEKTPDADR